MYAHVLYNDQSKTLFPKLVTSRSTQKSLRRRRHRLHQPIKVTTETFHSLLPREEEIVRGGQAAPVDRPIGLTSS